MAAATSRRVRASEHARRGHARGERTGRGARRPTRVGSLGHRDTRPLQRPRVAPAHARGPGRRGPAAQPPSAAAAHSPWHRRARPRTPWRPGILHRTGARRRGANRHSADSQTKRQLAGPFTISQRRESLSHVAGHPPQHTHTYPHSHTSPHPQAGPGANPRSCWDPRIHRHTLKVITVLHHRVTWRVPNTLGAPEGGLGRRPRQGCCGVGPRGLGLPAGAAPRCPPLPPPPRAPRPPRELGSQPVSASGPIGPRSVVSQQAGGGTPFEAVRQWSSPACSPSLPLWLCRAFSLGGPPGIS